MIVEMLPIFYTQRDNLFYTAWAFALPATLLRVPFSLAQSLLWSLIIYWSCGLAPTAARFFTFWLLTFLTHLVRVWGDSTRAAKPAGVSWQKLLHTPLS